MGRTSLRGKTALITGAGKRIGRAAALALAGEGVNIVIHYNHSYEDAEELVTELAELGVNSWTVKADFENQEEYNTLFSRALDLAGPIGILINNASIFPKDKLDSITFDSFNENMQVNAWVPFVLGRDFAKQMGRGMIINLLDSRISGYDWTHVGYIWSKHVLQTMTRMMALEFAPDIAVNGVAPGLILPPPGQDESYLDRLTYTVPLKRHGAAEDIAEAIVYLAGSSFITGEVIYVDGGRHLKEYMLDG